MTNPRISELFNDTNKKANLRSLFWPSALLGIRRLGVGLGIRWLFIRRRLLGRRCHRSAPKRQPCFFRTPGRDFFRRHFLNSDHAHVQLEAAQDGPSSAFPMFNVLSESLTDPRGKWDAHLAVVPEKTA